MKCTDVIMMNVQQVQHIYIYWCLNGLVVQTLLLLVFCLLAVTHCT